MFPDLFVLFLLAFMSFFLSFLCHRAWPNHGPRHICAEFFYLTLSNPNRYISLN